MSVRVRRWKGADGRRNEAWQVDIVFQHADGRMERVKVASPVNTRRGAEEYERKVRQALLDGSRGKEQQRTLTIREFLPRYLTYIENNNKHSTVHTKKGALELHILPFFGDMPMDEIGLAEIEEFKAQMRKTISRANERKENATRWAKNKRYGVGPKLLSPKTINNWLSSLRKLLVVANEQGALEHLPRIKLFKTAKPPFDFLSFDEADRLIAAADPEWRALLLVGIKAGLRVGEVCALQWADLDLVQARINVRHTIWRGHMGTPKGGRERTIDIPHSLVAALKAHRASTMLKGPFVFSNEKGTVLTRGQANTPLERALRRSGISRENGRISWHDLRHTYGSHLAMKGVPLKVIQELMGHATIEMTMRYAHLSPETKHDAVKVLDEPTGLGHRPTPARNMDGT